MGETLAVVIMTKPGAAIDADAVSSHVGKHTWLTSRCQSTVWLNGSVAPIASGKSYNCGIREQALRALAKTGNG